MFTEPKVLRDAQAMRDGDLHPLLDLSALPEPTLTDRELREYLQPNSRFEEVQP